MSPPDIINIIKSVSTLESELTKHPPTAVGTLFTKEGRG
jgi:hypothetical protein